MRRRTTGRRRRSLAIALSALLGATALSAAATDTALAVDGTARPGPQRTAIGLAQHGNLAHHSGLPRGDAPGSLFERRVRGTASADGADSTRLPLHGLVQVMLELDAAPASVAYADALPAGRRQAARAGRAQHGRVLASQSSLLAALGRPATRARALFSTSSVYAGIAVATDASRLPALQALPGVKAVHLMTPKRMANSSTVPLIGAPQAWSSSGTGTGTGAGVRIGIIDSGIDYTHADFGGPGTPAAYAAARASDTQAPAYPAGGNVVGGVDLAGDAYDSAATLADGSPDPARTKPQPDANPLDCQGHGTHVAGTAAGLGVTADGQTYRGPWDAGLRASDLRIGPGVAPGAQLYAIKIFGCTGATDLVAQGLDWAADPNRDGDVSDHLDVVNLSLGGDFASPSDPDAVAAQNLARIGTVVVAAAGNGGDLQDVAGSPGSAVRAISVAASDDASAVVDGLVVNSPAGIEPSPSLDGSADGVFGAEQSTGDPTSRVAAYDWAGKGGVTDVPLVGIGNPQIPAGPGNNADGCDPYSAGQAAAVSGRVVYLSWTDVGRRRCGSGTRGANAVAAGAVGVVLGDDTNSFTAGIAGDPRLPMMLVIKQGADALQAALAASHNDGSVRVTLTNAHQSAVRLNLAGTPYDPTDRIASFSSRGFGTAVALKPDVTAPGVTVFSAAVGTGAAGVSDSGTSMASPHVAGVAALVRAAHRSWTVEQVKAAIMDTAGARVWPQAGGSLPQSPVRVGAGRVQADRAVATTTLVYGADGTGAVGLSFGDIAVSANAGFTRGLRIVNTTGQPQTYQLAYRALVSTPGVAFSVTPSTVTVPAASSSRVVVRLQLTPGAMRRTLDPSMGSEAGLRSYYADAGGSIVVTGAGQTLTVPVYAAPRPASVMSAAPMALVNAKGDGTLALTGKDLLQGSGPDPATDPTLYASTVSALMLQGVSPRRPDCSRTVLVGCTPFADDRAGDLRYVGVASEVPYTRDAFNRALGAHSGYAYFGVSTWGPWRTPASYAEFDVYINTDAGVRSGNAEPELVLYNSRLAPDSDTMVATLADLRTGQIVDQQPLNAAVGSLDTGLFHSDSMILPLWLPSLLPYLPKQPNGTLASTRISYWVQAGTIESGQTDAVASQAHPLSVDLRSPALRAAGDAGGPALNDDAAGRDYQLRVHRDLSKLAADAPLGLLLIHHENRNGSRAQVVQVRGASVTALASSATAYTFGGRSVLTATVRIAAPVPSSARGTVTFRDGARVLGKAAVVRGRAVLRPGALLRGVHQLTATYDGDARYAASRSPAVRVTVAGLPSSTWLAVSRVVFGYGGRPTVNVRVFPATADGTVTLRDGSRVLGRAVLVRGAAVIRPAALSRGRHGLRATYNGSGRYAPSASAVVRLYVW